MTNGRVEVYYSEFRSHYAFDVLPTRSYQRDNPGTRFDCIVNAFDTKHDALREAECYAKHHGMTIKSAW